MMRNTPRTDGYSPAQLMFGRRQRTALPTLPLHHDVIDFDRAEEARRSVADKQLGYKNRHSVPLSLLHPGDKVSVQDVFTSRWSQQGVVESVRSSGQSYDIRLRNGKLLHRNRRFLRPAFSGEDDLEGGVSKPDSDANKGEEITSPRRSSRLASKTSVNYTNEKNCSILHYESRVFLFSEQYVFQLEFSL